MFYRSSFWIVLAAVLPFVFVAACATYANKIRQPRDLFEAAEYDGAVLQLQPLAAKQDNDELLYLMDLGLVLHTAGRYQEAIDVFLKADKLAEIKDYTSLTQEAASVVLSDEVKPYKGEDFEKILINVYLAIDYTMLHKYEDALVECRIVNHKLDKMIREGQLPYERNAFAKYLAAVLFEARREYNDAFVDYRQTLAWVGNYPYLGGPLLRVADKLKASQEFEEFQKRFPSEKDFRISKKEGEIVLVLEQGKAPIKVPSPQFRLLPKFERRGYASDYAWLSVGDGSRKARSFSLYDIEQTAIRELDHRIGLIAAKKIAGVVVKEAIANQVAKQTDNKFLGALTSLFLHATDQADLRSWTTLPARLHFARLSVPAGRHDVVLDMVTAYGSENKGVKRWEGVQVRPGETVFLNYRTRD